MTIILKKFNPFHYLLYSNAYEHVKYIEGKKEEMLESLRGEEIKRKSFND